MVTDDDQQHRGPGGPVAEADGTVPAVGVDGLPEPDPRPGEPAETSAGPSNGADPAPSATVTPPGVPADVGSDGPAPAVVEDPAAHPPPAEPPAIAPGPAEPRPLRSQHARRRRKRRITVWSVVALAVVVVAAAVVVAVQRVDHPLAQPTVASGHPTVTTVPGTAPTPPWPVSGQAAVAIPALGYAEQSGPEQPVPIASLTKMTTAVVVLRDHPVPLGADGPTITITPDEAAQFDVDLDNDETNIPLQAGETLTELQLLEALLNQSANDAAYTLAEWDAGSQPAFVAKMNALAASLGADGSHYVDASGFDPRSVSTAADTLRIAGAGMAIPTFAVVAGMPTVNLPGVGTVRNIVTAIGTDGIVGVKSGYTSQASGCMVLAGFRTIGGRSVLVLASALGQREPDPSLGALQLHRGRVPAAVHRAHRGPTARCRGVGRRGRTGGGDRAHRGHGGGRLGRPVARGPRRGHAGRLAPRGPGPTGGCGHGPGGTGRSRPPPRDRRRRPVHPGVADRDRARAAGPPVARSRLVVEGAPQLVTDRDGPSGRSVRVVTAGRDIDDALAIRRQVFIVEQHVPEELEYDGLDAGATHYLCSLDGRAIGTARVRCADGTAKIERVAVLADHRRDGVGRHLMEVVLSDLRHQEVTTIALASQTYAQDFYRGLGFVPVGDEFEDAGIPHISMVLRVRD